MTGVYKKRKDLSADQTEHRMNAAKGEIELANSLKFFDAVITADSKDVAIKELMEFMKKTFPGFLLE